MCLCIWGGVGLCGVCVCVCLWDLLVCLNWYLSLRCVLAAVPLRGGSDMRACVGISQTEEGSGGGGLE